MKRMKLILALFVGLTFVSCEKSTCDCTAQYAVGVNFQLQKDGQEIAIQEKFSEDSLEVMVERLKFYLSSIRFKNSSGSYVDASGIRIIDISLTELAAFQFSVDEGSYQAVNLAVGLTPSQNASDPATFPLEHPLSAFYGMYWSWAAKYKFMEFQGRANPDGTLGIPSDVAFSYHPGADEFHKSYDLPVNFTVSSTLTNITINIDYDTIFKGSAGDVNVLTENQSHTTPADYDIAEKIIFNFGESLTAVVH